MVYFDKEADFLEVLFEKTEGFFKETENDSIMEKISNDNPVIGFSILNCFKKTCRSRTGSLVSFMFFYFR